MNTEEIIKRYEPKKDNILLILHTLQNNSDKNYLTEDDIRWVAKYIKIPLSWVYGVVTYYSMFSLKPRGKYVIRLCKSPICHIKDNYNIHSILCEILNIHNNETTDDGLFSLEYTECLGQCDTAPVMMINEQVHCNLNKKRCESIIASLRKNALP